MVKTVFIFPYQIYLTEYFILSFNHISSKFIKDGAGRVGKMLYSRQGKKFDYDLKQVYPCALFIS